MVKSYCQLLTVKYVMYFKMNPNDEKFDIWLVFKMGICRNTSIFWKYINCRLVLEGKLAVIFSVIIIPHASVHRPRRWRALRPVRYIFWMLLKENCDTTCSPVSNTPVSSYDGVISVCLCSSVNEVRKVFVYVNDGADAARDA